MLKVCITITIEDERGEVAGKPVHAELEFDNVPGIANDRDLILSALESLLSTELLPPGPDQGYVQHLN